MKKYEELSYTEQNEIAALFGNWLQQYTHEVIIRVIEKRDEIISNEFSMNLLKELKEREEEEEHDFRRSIGHLLDNYNTFKEYNPHSHPLTHAKSYRDVLYDMYIR